ncbi:hypothetical protein ACFQ21_00095 [Ohtaekwangia kribbensis]|uniref:Roadblock/LAMTOR2 domain-containing protein n=1 Tax=Ohtaekwangia kribbensis TaxID=688913 RepID=A0ABW3JY12_9BACT
MTAQEEKLIRGLRGLLKVSAIVEIATVISVDAEGLSCDVQLADETDIPDVRLKAALDNITDGIVELPKVNSTVLVCLIGNDKQTRFVIACSEVDKVVMFDGTNGGVVKIQPLVDRMNAIEDKLNDLIGKFKEHTHIGVQTGGGTSGIPDPSSILIEDIDQTDREDLENTKVEH